MYLKIMQLKKAVSIALLLGAAFVLPAYATEQQRNSSSLQALPKTIQASMLAPLSGGGYLAVDEKNGVSWLNADGTPLAALAAPAELLDWREEIPVKNGKLEKYVVAATVRLPEQQPVIMVLNKSTKKISELVRLPIPSFKIESLCLSVDPAHNLSLYLLDERGTAEHWLVADAQGEPLIKKLRSVPIPPNSKSCSVDDQQESLFIAEEAIGVWRLNASVEAAPGRQLVDAAKPFGKLSQSVELVAALPGGLLAFEPQQKSVLFYRKQGDSYQLEKSQTISQVEEVENLSVVYDSVRREITAVLFDEATQRHWQIKSPWAYDNQNDKTVMPMVSVVADTQTETMARFGDAADDPAIWVNKKSPRKSRVIGTNKQQGLFVYDLQGKQVQHFNSGKLNNVDVRYGVPVGKKKMDIAVATHRDDNSLVIYTIDPSSGKLVFSGSVNTDLEEIYGFCLYQSASATYAIPNGKSGEFQQIKLIATPDENNNITWRGELVRRFYVKSQPEGCVADDKNQRLFVGEEDVALWTLGAEPTAANTPELVLAAGDLLVADVEGVGIYQGKQHSYVVVSSQGNNSFIVIDALPPFKVRGRVRIDMDAAHDIDGVSETDGLEVNAANFGGNFNEGMLVVQDGHKVMPEAPQNFKYVDWKKISAALQLD